MFQARQKPVSYTKHPYLVYIPLAFTLITSLPTLPFHVLSCMSRETALVSTLYTCYSMHIINWSFIFVHILEVRFKFKKCTISSVFIGSLKNAYACVLSSTKIQIPKDSLISPSKDSPSSTLEGSGPLTFSWPRWVLPILRYCLNGITERALLWVRLCSSAYR